MRIAASENGSSWITSVDQIVDASDASLRRSLVTLDGRGMVIKERAIQELLRREYERGLHEGVNIRNRTIYKPMVQT